MSELLRRPGYLSHVGNMKGVGRSCQQTFIDTYAKAALAKLYDRKTPITAAALVNDRVVPFYDAREVRLCRVLTDRGTEYCGNPEHHEYELYLALEDIDHWRAKTKSPQPTDVIDKCLLSGSDSCAICAIFLSRMGDRAAKSRARGASPAAQPSPSPLGCGARAHPLGTTRVPTGDEARVGRLGLLDPSALLIAMALDMALDIVRVGRASLATRRLVMASSSAGSKVTMRKGSGHPPMARQSRFGEGQSPDRPDKPVNRRG